MREQFMRGSPVSGRFFFFLLCRKSFFKRYKPPLRQPCPPKGGGGVSDAFAGPAQETSIFFIFVVQIIRHYR